MTKTTYEINYDDGEMFNASILVDGVEIAMVFDNGFLMKLVKSLNIEETPTSKSEVE
jgi:hypothetical protein